jgi:hypothetical protein
LTGPIGASAVGVGGQQEWWRVRWLRALTVWRLWSDRSGRRRRWGRSVAAGLLGAAVEDVADMIRDRGNQDVVLCHYDNRLPNVPDDETGVWPSTPLPHELIDQRPTRAAEPAVEQCSRFQTCDDCLTWSARRGSPLGSGRSLPRYVHASVQPFRSDASSWSSRLAADAGISFPDCAWSSAT